jgi:copper oxidase (laccase) domain-containing protein
MSDECTFCLPEKYYSYRYAKGTTGRQCGFIGIV